MAGPWAEYRTTTTLGATLSTGNALRTGVYLTADAGRTWRFRAFVPKDVYGPISFVASDVWIAADRDSLVVTVDGGQTWNTVHVDRRALGGAAREDTDCPMSPLTLSFVDGDTGWALLEAANQSNVRVLAATRDGGRSWRRLEP